jgi:phage-related protein (TIGR01555 family)
VARNRRVARLVPPPREPPAPEPTPKRSASVVRITESALATATAHRTKPYQIELPQFPPGVLPNDGHQMAADEALTDTLSWANTQFYSGVVEEGMTFLGYPVLAVMLQRPEYRVMAEEISSEMVREWIELKATGEDDRSEKIKEIGDEMRRLHVREVFGQAAFIDAAMGRAHIYLDTGDGDDRDELKTTVGDGSSVGSGAKINPEKRLIGIRTVEPIWSYPLHYNSIDPLSPDFYAPKIWAVMGKEIHHTRFLTLVGRPVPDILKPAYAFGGLSLTQMAKPYVENWLRTRQAVSDLIYNFSVMVLSTDLSVEAMANGASIVNNRLQFFNLTRNNRGVMAVNKDTEDLKNVAAPIGGLEGLQGQSQEHLASVSRIPIVKLLGIQPAGLNATSEGELRSFYDWIKAFCEALFREPLTTVINFIQLSLYGKVDPEITFDFKSLWQIEEPQRIAIEKDKAAIDDSYVQMGVIDKSEIRQRITHDKESIYHGLDLPEDELPEPEPEAGEGGGFNPFDPGGEPGGAPENENEMAAEGEEEEELDAGREPVAAQHRLPPPRKATADEDDDGGGEIEVVPLTSLARAQLLAAAETAGEPYPYSLPGWEGPRTTPSIKAAARREADIAEARMIAAGSANPQNFINYAPGEGAGWVGDSALDDFSETEHPRGEGGKFTSAGHESIRKGAKEKMGHALEDAAGNKVGKVGWYSTAGVYKATHSGSRTTGEGKTPKQAIEDLKAKLSAGDGVRRRPREPTDDEFKEGDHPRGEGGQFTDKGGASGGNVSELRAEYRRLHGEMQKSPGQRKAIQAKLNDIAGQLNAAAAASKPASTTAVSKPASPAPSVAPVAKADLDGWEEQALQNYRDGSYSEPINEAFRTGQPLPAHLADTVKRIDAAMAKSRLPAQTVYHGLKNWDAAVQKGVGGSLSAPGYLSSSKQSKIAEGFRRGGGGVIQIAVPKGAHGIDMGSFATYNTEHEVLLPRNTQLRITGVDAATRTATAEIVSKRGQAKDADFEETEHPRGEGGQFSSKGGGSGASSFERGGSKWEFGSGKIPEGSVWESTPLDEAEEKNNPQLVLGPMRTEPFDNPKLQATEVPVKELEVWQSGIDPGKLRPTPDDVEPINVYKINGHYIVGNGNHRAVSAWTQGRETIPAKVVDFNDPKNKKYWKRGQFPAKA